MKRFSRHRKWIGLLAVICLFVTGISFVNALRVSDQLLGSTSGCSTVRWFKPFHHGQFSPRWCATYWSGGGESRGMIAEIHVSIFGKLKYAKGYRVSGSNIIANEY